MELGTVLRAGASLVVPHIAYDDALDREVRALAVLPWTGAGQEEGEWTPVSVGEGWPDPSEEPWSGSSAHHALAVPGAVVSYLEGNSTSAPRAGLLPLHGLVP
ncbi:MULTISPECIES: hypothetical protein [unclassified Nocardiopsis]|uniref:hypothetical protein n=1 Tax=unclassified Nocardiopsis TaxID=2649073 RepID=UPI00135B460D|nr:MULTISPECIES: hypothetical protein [unclassified Nocardiopsis]